MKSQLGCQFIVAPLFALFAAFPVISWADEEPAAYRYAYSCDGYNQDRDDIAATAMSLALFDRAGLSGRLVHFHFNTNFGGEPTHAEEHRRSALQTAVLFGLIESENADDQFFDVAHSEEERRSAIEHLALQMKRSTAQDPLIMICAGGVQLPCLAMEQAQAQGITREAMQSITFLSHSEANENTRQKNATNPDYRMNWNDLKQLAPEARFVDHDSPLVNGRRDGGVMVSQNSTAWTQAPRDNRHGVEAWQWLKGYGPTVKGFGFSGTKGDWLLERLKAAGAPELGINGDAEGDASDAGMIFGFVLGQPTDARMGEIKTYFMR